MRLLVRIVAPALAAAAFAPTVLADGRNPGSTLVYPIHRSGAINVPGEGSQLFFTVVSITNINTAPVTPITNGGATNVRFNYLNTVYNSADPQLPLDCYVCDRVEYLTPADTLSVLTGCHNCTPGFGNTAEGFLVATAENPTAFSTPWSHNYLLGSELVVSAFGAVYSIEAVPFESPLADGVATDLDSDGQVDFNGAEYEGIPEFLYIDSFVAIADSSLTLLNLTGTKHHVAAVQILAWNDNEYPLSATKQFRCWFDQKLKDVSLIFDNNYLHNNTPDDPDELDINCDNNDDFETGWARINGIVANSSNQSLVNPALLGAITTSGTGQLDGGRLLAESKAKQCNGAFFELSSTINPLPVVSCP